MIDEEKFKTEIIKDAEKYVEKIFKEDFSGHDFFSHVVFFNIFVLYRSSKSLA